MTGCGSRLTLAALCLMVAQVLLITEPTAAQTSNINNPIQVRFEQFTLELGPTNNARPLGIRDADIILGVVEDLITDFARKHYLGLDVTSSTSTTTKALQDSGSNDEEGMRTSRQSGGDSLVFQYAILGLVEIDNSHPEELRSRTTTVLKFSGGIAYFAGYAQDNLPTAAEVQMLISLALNQDDLIEALQVHFPYIKEATYTRGSTVRDPTTDVGAGNDVSPFMDSPIALDGDEQASQEQLIIVIVSACGAAIVFCLLVAIFYIVRQRERRAFWRDDGQQRINSSKSPITVEQDAALDDLSLTQDQPPPKSPIKRRSMMKEAKQQSLHLRDSLRDMSMQDQDVNDVHSDNGSSKLGCLLSSAAAAAVCAKTVHPDPSLEKQEKAPSGDATTNMLNAADSPGDQDTSSCSHDDSSNESVHSKEYETCPSDFEGNAIVKPNLLPVTNLDRFRNDDPHNPLPPSQTAAARQDDGVITLSMDEQEPVALPPVARPKTLQEGFLAKYFNPISGSILPLGSVGLSYFSSATHDDDDEEEEEEEDDGNDADCEEPYYKTPRREGPQHLTPKTATSTVVGDQDSRWSDVSSGYKTDDDFELDRAWDPDDTSVNSSENGRDIFSPMSSDDDEIRLLDSLGSHSYNLHKLRTPPKPKQDPNRRALDVMDTEEV